VSAVSSSRRASPSSKRRCSSAPAISFVHFIRRVDFALRDGVRVCIEDVRSSDTAPTGITLSDAVVAASRALTGAMAVSFADTRAGPDATAAEATLSQGARAGGGGITSMLLVRGPRKLTVEAKRTRGFQSVLVPEEERKASQVICDSD
jgi:hypothetical protein